MSWMNEFVVADDVLDALNNHKPVVALESTIISHGMPYPDNVAVAKKVEAAVRANGAVPATIAILSGRIHIGLTPEQLEQFAQARDVMKCSRRDLPFAVSGELNGATTVSATMMIAEMAGIDVFATGGIGGVHRGAEVTFDISADLQEFAQTSVTVVSAGAKAILDIPKTLEYLETMGVPVIGLGTAEFPAFYSRSSGQTLSLSLPDTAAIASVIHEKKRMNLKGGILVANPIPAEFEIPASEIEPFIQQALLEAQQHGVIGKDLTPFLLKTLNKATAGKSQQANEQLVLNNAAVAARIACDLIAIRRKQPFIAL
jgi:pseudouridine-5'-phosphate glycosidase